MKPLKLSGSFEQAIFAQLAYLNATYAKQTSINVFDECYEPLPLEMQQAINRLILENNIGDAT